MRLGLQKERERYACLSLVEERRCIVVSEHVPRESREYRTFESNRKIVVLASVVHVQCHVPPVVVVVGGSYDIRCD